MKPSEMILLAGLAVFAGGLLFDAANSMPYASDQGFGPGFVPINMALAILALIALIVVPKFRKASTLRSEPAGEGHSSRPAVITMGLLAAALLAMSFGSVMAPLAVALTIVSTLFLDFTWRRAAVASVAVMAIIYAVFSLWLKIPLT